MGERQVLDARWFLALLVVAAAIPLVFPQIPPLVDLPGHMGRYYIQTHIDRVPALAQWFSFEWKLLGNLGIDLLIVPVSKLFGIELGTKLIILAIPPLTVLGMLWTAREAAGRVPPATLFALPLAYSYPLHFGFVNFSLSVALALNLLALWIRLGRKGRIGTRALLFVPLSCLLWLCHMVGWGLFGLCAFGTELVRRKRGGENIGQSVIGAGLTCLPLAFPILPTLLLGQSRDALAHGWFEPRLKLAWILSIFRDRWRVFDTLCALAAVGLIGLALIGRRLHFDWLLGLPAAICLVTFLCMPFQAFGSAYADMRLAPFTMAVGLLAVRGRDARADRWLLIAGLVFFGVRIAATTASFALYDGTYRAELRALEHVPRGASVLSLVSRNCNNDWFQQRLDHLPAIALIRRQAFSNDQWTVDSAQGLRVIKGGAGYYGGDPSELVYPRKCNGWGSKLDEAIRDFPRQAFDYVWTIHLQASAPDLQPIWSNGRSTLYRVRREKAAG